MTYFYGTFKSDLIPNRFDTSL